MRLHITQLPCDEATFLAKLELYRAARESHKLTIGIPAPFPEYEVMRVIVDSGEPLEIIRDELQEQAKAVARDALAELDAAKEELEVLKTKIAQSEAAK